MRNAENAILDFGDGEWEWLFSDSSGITLPDEFDSKEASVQWLALFYSVSAD